MTRNKGINAVLAICRVFVREEGIDEKTLKTIEENWEVQIFQMLVNHKLTSVCHKVLHPYKDSFQKNIYGQLSKRTRQIGLRNLTLYRESTIVRKAFTQEGLSTRPYKGVSFARNFYSNLSLRHSIDVDFAIRLEDLEKCQDIMHMLKYQEVKGTINSGNIRRSRAYYLDYPWRKITDNGFQVFVEFHLSPAHKALYVPCDFSSYLNKSYERGKPDSNDFSLVEQALFILIHHGAVDIWDKLMHLLDLHQILTVLDKDQIDEFLILCEQSRVRKFLDLGIQLCERMLNTSYPILPKYKIPVALITRIEHDCLHSKLIGKWSENRDKLNYHLSLRDSKLDRLRSLGTLGRYGIYKKLGI